MYWRKKLQCKPKIIAEENQLWGAERIRGELLKLGIEVSQRSIQKYMPKDRKSRSSSDIVPMPLRETWTTFLKDQASDIWACDWMFRQWYIFVLMELKTCRIVHTGVTRFPTDEWTAQQLREVTPWGNGPKYLIRDRDSKYATHFSAVAVSSGIKELKTPYRTPQANGVCERFMGSLRRECLDHIFIHEGRHLERVVKEYTTYFNQERPHQGIAQCVPNHYELPKSRPTSGRIISKEILGGLYHSHSRTAYLN
jgi:transposase InsO family protein